MKLFEIADEPHIDLFIEWFISLTRSFPQKLWAVKEIWDAISWKIALAMRKGAKFDTISAEAMADTNLRHEILIQEPPKKADESPDKRTARSQAHKGKGGGRGQRRGQGGGGNGGGNGGYETPRKTKGRGGKRGRPWKDDDGWNNWDNDEGQNWDKRNQNYNRSTQGWTKKKGGRWNNGR